MTDGADDSAGPPADSQAAWNRLYQRAIASVPRSPGEADSVPFPTRWGELPEAEWRAMQMVTDRLPSTGSVIDLGCGTGSILAALLRRQPALVGLGIDASDVAVGIGRRELAAAPMLADRMKLEVGDMLRLDHIDTGSVDLAIAITSLQFLTRGELLQLAGEVRRLLRPGGFFAVRVRSASRSVPASYVPVRGEPNTWVSHEPHEAGMRYHHVTADEVDAVAEAMGGNLVHRFERFAYRGYDVAPRRAWWDFVVERPLPQAAGDR